MITLKFKTRLVTIGNSKGIIIPAAIARLLGDKKYEFTIKEVDNNAEENNTTI